MIYIIYQTAFIGDIILSTSMVKTINDIDPEGKIVFITTVPGESLLKNNKRIDKIITFDKRQRDKGLTGLLNIINEIKEIIGGSDTIYISTHRFIRASILGVFIGSGTRVGFKGSFHSFLYNNRVQYRLGIHEIERNFELLKAAFDVKLSGRNPGRPELFPSEDDLTIVKNIIADEIGNDGRIVSIAPGSIWYTKRWPTEYFKKLVELLNNRDISVILIGGKDDQEICCRIASEKSLNLAGRLSLLESAAAISLSSAIITNDSAPLHMASAMNIPTVAIFGATTLNFGFWPLADISRVLENKGLDCRPCGRHGGKTCREKHFNCMKKISPEMVFNEIIQLI